MQRTIGVAAIIIAIIASSPGPTRAQDRAAVRSMPSILSHLGPSFPCPAPQDPLAQLICSSAQLSKDDLRLVQAYQALRYQLDQPGKDALTRDAIAFTAKVRAQCGIPASGSGLTVDAAAIPCVNKEYEQEHDLWASLITGPAAEEATRPLRQHVALQADLKALGFLPPDSPIDGVYGPETRAAIKAWQRSKDLPPSGFLDSSDGALLAEAVRAARITGTGVPDGEAARDEIADLAILKKDNLAKGIESDSCTPQAIEQVVKMPVHVTNSKQVQQLVLNLAKDNFGCTEKASLRVGGEMVFTESVESSGPYQQIEPVSLLGDGLQQIIIEREGDDGGGSADIWSFSEGKPIKILELSSAEGPPTVTPLGNNKFAVSGAWTPPNKSHAESVPAKFTVQYHPDAADPRSAWTLVQGSEEVFRFFFYSQLRSLGSAISIPFIAGQWMVRYVPLDTPFLTPGESVQCHSNPPILGYGTAVALPDGTYLISRSWGSGTGVTVLVEFGISADRLRVQGIQRFVVDPVFVERNPSAAGMLLDLAQTTSSFELTISSDGSGFKAVTKYESPGLDGTQAVLAKRVGSLSGCAGRSLDQGWGVFEASP